MKRIVSAVLLLLPFAASAQRSPNEYPTAQRSALQTFLRSNRAYSFQSQSWFNNQAYQFIVNDFDNPNHGFKPYYVIGDFNRDGRGDFATILKKGDNPIMEGRGNSLAVVIFNQNSNGTYRAAHTADVNMSLSMYLGSNNGRLRLNYFESEGATFVPSGRGYRMNWDQGISD